MDSIVKDGSLSTDTLRLRPRRADGPGRRTLMRFGVASLVVPLGAMAPTIWRPSQSLLPNTIDPAICRAAGDDKAVAPGSVPRELKICWSTTAVCTVGVAVADERGFFAKRNL